MPESSHPRPKPRLARHSSFFIRHSRRSGALFLLAAASGLALWLAADRNKKHAENGLADGFDYPVGAPDAAGYYRSRGFTPGKYAGEQWNGRSGGDTDLGDPVSAIGAGEVVFAKADGGKPWGGVIIIRHRYLQSKGTIETVDSLYGHVQKLAVTVGDLVERGQPIAEIGNVNGAYSADLRLELRKNPAIGLDKSQYKIDFSNYHSPSSFISSRRPPKSWFTQFREWLERTLKAIVP